MAHAQEVTDSTFDAVVLGSDKPVLVEFWAPWCGPCRLMAPMLDELAEKHEESLGVVMVDIAISPVTQQRYEVMSTPTMIVFSGGQPVKRMTGAKPMAALLKELREFL